MSSDPSQPRTRQPDSADYADDEISLLDLWIVLRRRRFWIGGILLASVLLSGIYAVIHEPTYDFRSAVQLGSYRDDDGEQVFLESRASFIDKLREAYIPDARQALANGDEDTPPEVAVSNEEDSTVFVLRTTSPLEQNDRIRALHERIVQSVLDAHGDRMAVVLGDRRAAVREARVRVDYLDDERVRRARLRGPEARFAEAERDVEAVETDYAEDRDELTDQIRESERRLEGLSAERSIIQAHLARLDERADLLERQAENLRPLAEALTQDMGAEAEGADLAALLLASAQAAEVQHRLDQLEEELLLGLSERRDELTDRLQDNRLSQREVEEGLGRLEARRERLEERYERELAAAEDRVRTAELERNEARANYEQRLADAESALATAERRLEGAQATEVIFAGEPSLTPNGPGAGVIVALGAILGAMLGIFGAFGAEFVARAREYAKELSV